MFGSVGSGDKIIGRRQSLGALIRFAYDPEQTSRTILPDNFPKGSFDLMLTLTERPREALREAIKSKFGYVAHLETIETNVLILHVKNPGGPALQPTKGGEPTYSTRAIEIKNQQMDGVAACFSALLKTRVVDKTGIEGRYDVALQWQARARETDEEAIKRTVLDQLGFDFLPSRQSFKYLIVEKVK